MFVVAWRSVSGKQGLTTLRTVVMACRDDGQLLIWPLRLLLALAPSIKTHKDAPVASSLLSRVQITVVEEGALHKEVGRGVGRVAMRRRWPDDVALRHSDEKAREKRPCEWAWLTVSGCVAGACGQTREHGSDWAPIKRARSASTTAAAAAAAAEDAQVTLVVASYPVPCYQRSA